MAGKGVVWDDEAPAPTSGVVWDDEPSAPAQPKRTAVPDELTESGGLSHGPGTSFALNALDSLSIVGLPTTLAMKDALLDGGEGTFRERYRKRKGFYEGGMERLANNNKKSALAGQLAPALIPGGALAKGAKLLPTMGRGAATGAASGLLRGQAATLDGDIEGTVLDGVYGAGAGAALSGAGAAAGKAVEAGGKLARKGMDRVLREVADRTASAEGRFAKIQQAGQGARRNLPDDIEAVNKTLPPRGFRKEALEDQLLAKEAVAYGKGAKAEAHANKMKWGHRAAPPKAELDAKHMGELQSESWKGAGQLATTAALGFGGYHAAKKLGVDPYLGAVGAGGAGAAFVVRKAAASVARNPAAIKKLMALEPFGRWMARTGGKAGAAPSNVAAVVYALRDHPEVKKVLEEEASKTEVPLASRSR